jgi:uncharacterized membrane protein YfcA
MLMGKTLYAAISHYRLGNVDIKLGTIMGTVGIAGVEAGKRVVIYLERANPAETYVRVAYMVLMLIISFSMLKEYYDC